MKHSFFCLSVSKCRAAALALALFFLLGQLLGLWFSAGAGDLLMTSMRAAPGGRISLGGAVSSALLPLLLSAFAVYVRQPLLLIPIAFWKAFLFSYVTCGLYLSWGSAGWLVSGLLMSVSAWSMPVLCWYWLRHIGGRPFDKLSFGISFGALAVIGILNDCLIVPFLADIITF